MPPEQNQQLPVESPEAKQLLKTEKPPPDKKLPLDASKWQRFRRWFGEHKKWAIPASVLAILLILAVVPWTRYKAAGLVVKKNFTIEVLDAASQTPVSEATVKVGSKSAQTDGDGRATLRLSAGRHSVLISKKYYKDHRAGVLVPILSQKTTPEIAVDATGRQAKIIVKNLISQKPLADADIKVADIAAKTDKNGEAIVVLPVGTAEQKAKLGLEGYNDSEVTVKISDSSIAENNFTLTPAGKAYFLSKRTGKLDLMKANLDGSNPQVVLAGTGTERDYDTAILTSPSQKYVVLQARRSTDYSTAQLYILTTDDDEILGFDNGEADFSLVGWSGDNLIYTVTRTDLPVWRTGNDKLKSYNAGTGKITLLNQSSAAGDSNSAAYELYDFFMLSAGNVIYAKNWYDTSGEAAEQLLDGKTDSLSIIGADGQGNKSLATYEAIHVINYSRHKPNGFYVQQQSGSGDNKIFEFTAGATVLKTVNIDESEFLDSYRLFYISPSGKKSLWAEDRDGKFTIFVGEADGSNPKEVASLSEYAPYGWFNDEYFFVTKEGSELHIMSTEGGKPVKITDFQPTTYFGY